ncbi:MAG: VOC family protein [Ilumatobacteraceae bacterium]
MTSLSENDLVLGFSHVNLLVTDLEAARRFYGDGLGLAQLPRPEISGQGAWFRVGSLQLHVSLVQEMPANTDRTTSHIALQLSATAFASTVAAIELRGVVLTRGPQTSEQFDMPVQTAFCRDPSGNLIELTDVGQLE